MALSNGETRLHTPPPEGCYRPSPSPLPARGTGRSGTRKDDRRRRLSVPAGNDLQTLAAALARVAWHGAAAGDGAAARADIGQHAREPCHDVPNGTWKYGRWAALYCSRGRCCRGSETREDRYERCSGSHSAFTTRRQNRTILNDICGDIESVSAVIGSRTMRPTVVHGGRQPVVAAVTPASALRGGVRTCAQSSLEARRCSAAQASCSRGSATAHREGMATQQAQRPLGVPPRAASKPFGPDAPQQAEKPEWLL